MCELSNRFISQDAKVQRGGLRLHLPSHQACHDKVLKGNFVVAVGANHHLQIKQNVMINMVRKWLQMVKLKPRNTNTGE
jgi:hypothetical protein